MEKFEGATRTIGAEARHLHANYGVEEYDSWMVTAKPGASLRYGIGFHALSAAAPGVAARLRALSEAGLVTLHLKRARPKDVNYPIDFLVVRTKAVLPRAFPDLTLTHDEKLRRAAGRKS